MLSSKGPGATLVKEKWPSCAVGVSSTGVVVKRVSLTSAPETGAPVVSSTVPSMLPSVWESCACLLVGVLASAERPSGSLAAAAMVALSACANRRDEPSRRTQIIPAAIEVTRMQGFGLFLHKLGPIGSCYYSRKQHLQGTGAVPERVALFERLAQLRFARVA